LQAGFFLYSTRVKSGPILLPLCGFLHDSEGYLVHVEFSPDFQFEILPMNLRAFAFICIYAGSNTIKPLRRSTPRG